MLTRRFYQVGRKFLVGSAGLLLGWIGTGTLAAQMAQPGAVQSAAPVQRNYLNKSLIQLPIQINEQSRALIQEIQLFMKDQPNAPWTLRDRVGPGAKVFTCELPQDGEYWFTMVVIDKKGRGNPNDLRNEPPGLVVVIDTQRPHIEVTNLGTTSEGHLLQCEVRDANLDATRTQLSYQGGDRNFRALEPAPGRAGVFCIPPQAVYTGVVRVTAEDLAGNQAQQEVNLNQLPVARSAPAQAPIVLEMPPPRDLKKPAFDMPLPRGEVQKPVGIEQATLLTFPPTTPAIKPELRSANLSPSGGSGRPDGSDGPHWLVEHRVEAPPSAERPKETLKRQFVNNTRVFLDYQIENAGPAGVSKVEVWITRDRAKSWQKLSADAPKNNQLEIHFPGEGVFGVTLVATSAGGVAGPAPKAGDAPDWWVEVDTTHPVVHLTKVEPVQEDGKTSVHIAWTAQDKNFGDTPVRLFYGKSPQGPWQPIAKALRADGKYRWLPSAEAGAKAYLRLVARDNAGNESGITTREAVSLEVARPRAVIRGISTPPTPAPTAPTPPTFQIVQPPPIR